MRIQSDAINAGKNSNDHSTTTKPSNSVQFVVNFTAGAIAGALAKTVIAPLDRAKINFQISKAPYSAKEAIQFLVNSYKNDGLKSLWRGNSATMARIIPYAAIQFSAHEQWKILLNVDQDKSQPTSPIRRLIAGSLAGVTGQALTYPLDITRARMAVTQKCRYQNLKQTIVLIWKEEGPKTLFRGFNATVIGVIPYAGVSFFTYGTLKDSYLQRTGKENINPLERLMFGAAAGLVGQTSSYPFDIVRRRMQTSSVKSSQYQTVIGTMLKVYREEGLRRGLFKGLSMNWVKGPVAVGISFSTYETLQQYLILIVRKIS